MTLITGMKCHTAIYTYIAAHAFHGKNLKHFPLCIFPKKNCNTVLSANQEIIFTVLKFTFVLQVAHSCYITNFLLSGLGARS